MSRPLYIQNPFVGRQREQHTYQQMLTRATPWVMVITGQGGMGKSTLLRHLAEITPQAIPVVLLNFANETLRSDRLDILEQFSWQLAVSCDAQQRSAFEQTLAQARTQLADLSRQLIQNVQIGDNASASGIDLDMRGFDAASLRERRLQIQAEVMQALYRQVLTFQPTRPVIMLDTCEWLSEAEGLDTGRWVMDELLPKIHACLAQHHRPCTVVIASRMSPPLSAIERQDCHPFTLPMLEEAAVDLYLEQVGMQDAALRHRVYAITHGHALCVAIIGTLWQEQDDQPLTLDELPQLQDKFNERALLEFIQDRLDKRLVSPFRELTRFGVLLRSFNLPMLQAIFPELFSGPNAHDIFQQFIRYPYIESLGHQRRVIHELLREIQAVEIRNQQSDEWLKYHKRALDYHAKVSPQSPDWYYHAIACDEEQGMSDWWDAVVSAHNQGRREDCWALLQVLEDVTLELTPSASAQYAFHMGRYHFNWTDMSAAMESYAAALGLFQKVGDRLGEANVRQAMGDVQQFRKENEAAMESYAAALGLFQKVGSRLGEANVRKAMGDVQQFRKENEAAMESYAAALGLFQKVGSRLGEANVRQAMGDVQRFRDENEAAMESYAAALGLFQKVGDRLGEANVRQAMGDVQRFRDENEAAMESYAAALGLFQKVGSRLGEANVRKAMGDVQQFRKENEAAMESYAAALGLFQKVGSRLGEANVRKAMGDVQRFRDENEAAMESYAAALGLFQKVGDRLGEANVRQAMGDVQRFRDENEAAMESYAAALGLFQKVGSRLGEANVRQAMGDVQQFRKENEAAMESYAAALGLFQKVGSRLGEANCYLEQGRIALKAGKHQESLTLHNLAYQLYQLIQDGYSQARLLYYRSYVYGAMNDRQQALQDMEQCMAMIRPLKLTFVDIFQKRLDELH